MYTSTIFPHKVAAATILFWKLKCGKYSREETIVFLLFVKKKDINRYWWILLYFMQFRSSKLIFGVKRLLKLKNIAQKVPHLAIWLFFDNICNNYSSEKLLKGGNYSREETIRVKTLHMWEGHKIGKNHPLVLTFT